MSGGVHPGRVTRGWSLEAKMAYYSDPPNERGCRLWRGCMHVTGYGFLKVKGENIKTHRLAWELANGPIPDGLCVCHHCDTPACIEVDHLFLGTRADNNADKGRKGRGTAKLTGEQVIAIRAMRGSEAGVAAQFGVSAALVGYIRRRQHRKYIADHLEGNYTCLV